MKLNCHDRLSGVRSMIKMILDNDMTDRKGADYVKNDIENYDQLGKV